MENIVGFSFHEQQFKMVPTPSTKENVSTDSFMEGESSKQNNAISYPSSMNIIPLEKNKIKMLPPCPLPRQKRPWFPLIPDTITNVRVSLPLDQAIEYELEHGRRKLDTSMDSSKLRRTVSNRIYAHRTRVRKEQYVHDMEAIVQQLEEKISFQKEQIESIKMERELLLQHKNALQNQLEILCLKAKCSEEEIEKNKAEIEELQGFERMVNTTRCKYPTLGFYQDGLEKLQQAASSSKSELQTVPNFNLENHGNGEDLQSIEIKHLNEMYVTIENNQEEAVDIAQYFNFDEMNLNTSSSVWVGFK